MVLEVDNVAVYTVGSKHTIAGVIRVVTRHIDDTHVELDGDSGAIPVPEVPEVPEVVSVPADPEPEAA